MEWWRLPCAAPGGLRLSLYSSMKYASLFIKVTSRNCTRSIPPFLKVFNRTTSPYEYYVSDFKNVELWVWPAVIQLAYSSESFHVVVSYFSCLFLQRKLSQMVWPWAVKPLRKHKKMDKTRIDVDGTDFYKFNKSFRAFTDIYIRVESEISK